MNGTDIPKKTFKHIFFGINETATTLAEKKQIAYERFTDGKTNIPAENLENLAKWEYLRFFRCLLAHGYTFDIEDDDVIKTYHQICPWDKLNERDKQYHRDMVKASLL